MKKIRLIETVTGGSHIRKTVDPGLIIGDKMNGYIPGDILDANATSLMLADIRDALASLDERVSALEPPTYEAVDLGLPSGTLWANMNLGATSEEEAGLYFSWGNVHGVAGDDAAGIAAMTESAYASTSGASLETDIPATAANDAAVANVGGNWRMPTSAEFQELHTNCDWTWKQVNGVNGYEVKSKASGNTNSIFLPAAGYIFDGALNGVGTYGNYWSSSIFGEAEGNACDLDFGSEGVYPDNYGDCYCGYSVRPVQNA